MSAVTVLGMQHSGTSCLAECLVRAGVRFGEVRKNTYESQAIMRLHESLVDWATPKVVVPTTNSRQQRDEIVASYGEGAWGWKEPLTLFTLDLWREALDVRLVGTFRHPLFVVSRVARLFGGHAEKWERLWVTYNERLLALHNESPFPMVSFDNEPEAYRGSVDYALDFLGVDRQPGADLGIDLMRRSDEVMRGFRVSDEAERLYQRLLERVAYPARGGATPPAAGLRVEDGGRELSDARGVDLVRREERGELSDPYVVATKRVDL